MACISKLANAITYDCDSGATGLVSALIINKSDIASYSVDTTGTATVALAAGARAYKIDTVKRTLVLSSALKVNDGAPNAHTHTATITVTTTVLSGSLFAQRNALTNGTFVILARAAGDTGGHVMVYGLYYGLSATGMDTSSHDNAGWTTVTLETPENVIGEDPCTMTSTAYDALYAEAVG